ncbi:MAG: hypothetical protein ACFE7R_11325 [Candidatus Hodarchaeota archaeon]
MAADPDKVRNLLQEMIEGGEIDGQLTEDGMRFFLNDVKLSDKPIVPSVETPPAFMRYDTRPGIFLSFLGAFILVGGLWLFPMAETVRDQDTSSIIILIGSLIILAGCCQISRRGTPW